MKKKMFTEAFVLALLISTVAGTLLVNSAKANNIPLLWYPAKPDKTPPVITVYSPSQNQNYNSTIILLNFTVSKPETWFSHTASSEEYMPGTYMAVGRVLSYNYTLDGNESETISVQDLVHLTGKPEETLSFSSNLTVTYGAHNITLIVECESRYVPFEGYGVNSNSVPVYGYSEVINFTVAKSPEPEPEQFPTTIFVAASGTSATIIGISLLFYFKKHKQVKLDG